MKRVLIIDDDCLAEKETILESFAETDVEPILCSTKEEAMKWINTKALFNCIVLDWFLEDDESSLLSQQILREIEGKYYAPVLIYTAHAENYRAAKEAGEITYPDNLIKEVDKVNFTEISAAVNSWLNENYTAQLSAVYLGEVYASIHKAFCDLNNIPHGNIASVYKHIIYENGNIDWNNDFIINLLLNEITSNESFRNNLIALVDEVRDINPATTPEDRKKVLNRILYYKSNSQYLANGDIVQITTNRDRVDTVKFGIIVTPNCDLAHKNTKYIEIIELIEHRTMPLRNTDGSISGNKNISHYFLPGVRKIDDSFIDLVAVYKSKKLLVSMGNDGNRYPEVNERLSYNGSFSVDNSACRINYLCSLMNPYKSEFMQKKNSHDSRIGIPEVYKYLNTP